MHTFVQKSKATPQGTPASSTISSRAHLTQSRVLNSSRHLQRANRNQAEQRLVRSNAEELNAGLTGTASPHFGHDFSRIPIHAHEAAAIQTKLEIGEPGDKYEQEADRMSEHVMRMEARDITHTEPPVIQRLSIGAQEELAAKRVQCLCTECEEEDVLHRKAAPADASANSEQALYHVEAKIDAVSGGQPLTKEQQAFFEPRFGANFSHVRIHTDQSADTAARAVGAQAYTRGSDIVFRGDQYHPHTYAGRQLLAHELTHVVQQGAAPRIQDLSVSENGEQHVQNNDLLMGMGILMLQPFPGDGMVPPGDCSWVRYLLLRGSVETAKAVVSTLGACSRGDNCLTLATKIAAITAEIAARVALDATCFKGGDTGHRQQVQDKISMMNRCYQFFSNSNCPPELIAAMAVVVEQARLVIAAGAVVVAIALVVALIAAIIALAEVIVALLAAAAESAVVVAAVEAVIALLTVLEAEFG
jgi:hypothetical protein